MMRLVSIQTVLMPVQAEADSEVGKVPIIGGPEQTTTITRGWFQCDCCGLIGALDELASPMMPPPCAQGCDDPSQTGQ